MRKISQFVGFSAVALLGLATAACGGSGAAPAEGEEAKAETAQSAPADADGGTLQGDLEVFAAASLQSVFDELLEKFAAENPDVNVLPAVYDGSSVLATQLLEGAPADVFASADLRNMDKVNDEDLLASAPEVFALNELTIAVPSGNPAGIKTIKDLENADLKVVICAPEVPCGGATVTALESNEVTLVPVSEEQNVTAVAQKVASGEADAGFVYLTDVKLNESALEAISIDGIEESLNNYPIAPLKTDNDLVSQAFIAFVMSDEGQKILASYGFRSPLDLAG